MSANSGNLKKGLKVYHRGIIKTVKDWHFESIHGGGPHNSDCICIQFTDGTSTGSGEDQEGWSKIKEFDVDNI